MAITLVQKVGKVDTGLIKAIPPAWSTPTTAGNLLLIAACEVNGTNNTWPTAPTGYTAAPSTPFIHYNAGITGVHGLYYKIAAGADATPSTFGESSGTQDWVTYLFEFAAPGGWLALPADVEAHSAVRSTQFATPTATPAVTTATLAQANELVFCLSAHDIATTLETHSGGLVIDRPTTANGKLWTSWVEVNATTAFSTTAVWTTSARCGLKLQTFKTAAAGGAVARQLAATGVGR